MPTQSKYAIYVAVHKGDPVDFAKFRHTGLWCVPEDSPSHYYFHAHGLTGEFAFERRKNFDPTSSRSFAKNVSVGKTKHALSSSELSSLMESVLVANDDPEFNCHQWIQSGLRTLQAAGYLTEEQYNAGVDGMIKATLEAEDEHLAQ